MTETYVELSFTLKEVNALLSYLTTVQTTYTDLGIAKAKLIEAQYEYTKSR